MAPFSLSTRPRRSLPEGYQFGDAKYLFGPMTHEQNVASSWTFGIEWEWDPDPPERSDWNVIEGEPFVAQRDLGDEA